MPSPASEKAKAAAAAKVTEEGRFAAHEEDDNAIDLDNPSYVGVDPEYRNAAVYDGVALEAPLDSEDADAVADKVKASAEELGDLDVNRLGHTPGDHRAGQNVKVADQQAAAAAAAAADNGTVTTPDADADGAGNGVEGGQSGSYGTQGS